MDATSSYQAATKIDQTPLQSAQEIYIEAVSLGGEIQSAAGLDTNFDSADNPMASSGGGTLHPFQVYKQDSDNIRVNGGTVGGIAYATPNTDIAISSDKDVYIDVTVNNSTGQPTAVTVSAADTKPDDTSTHAYILISQVTVSGGAIEDTPSFIVGSLGYGYGGGTIHLVWRG